MSGERQPAEPIGGAGLYNVDPDQRDVSQDPMVAIVGNVEALPEEVDL